MQLDLQQYILFLKSLEILAEKYDSRDAHSFNIFSALRSPSDEVNLHSRFLVTLLNHYKPGDENMNNLKDFVDNVSGIEIENFLDDYKHGSVHVERERHNIDILISHPQKKNAVIIENKINAYDQPNQLQNYVNTLNVRGFQTPHVVYLTLDGHEPSEGSKGNLNNIDLISYKRLLPWLKRCQERAFDEPELRETISQYITLISEMTGTDSKGDHMKKLRNLLLEDKNIALAFELNAALQEAKIYLLKELWVDIAKALENECDETDFPFSNRSAPEEGNDANNEFTIRDFFTSRKVIWHGLWYQIGPPFKGARLGIEIGYHMHYGIRCNDGNQDSNLYEEIQKVLSRELGQSENQPNNWWPWYQRAGRDSEKQFNFRTPNKECLLFLVNCEQRKEFATDVAKKTIEVWQTLPNLSEQF